MAFVNKHLTQMHPLDKYAMDQLKDYADRHDHQFDDTDGEQ